MNVANYRTVGSQNIVEVQSEFNGEWQSSNMPLSAFTLPFQLAVLGEELDNDALFDLAHDTVNGTSWANVADALDQAVNTLAEGFVETWKDPERNAAAVFLNAVAERIRLQLGT